MWLPTMQTQAVSEFLRKNENFPDTAHALSYGVETSRDTVPVSCT